MGYSILVRCTRYFLLNDCKLEFSLPLIGFDNTSWKFDTSFPLVQQYAARHDQAFLPASSSLLHIVWLTLLIAFSEEILFRGIVQQQFGLEIASIVFALLHFRYLSKILLFILVVSISIFLGLLYEWTGNLFVPVMTHFVIDLVFACQIRFKYWGRDEHGRNVENEEKKAAADKHP